MKLRLEGTILALFISSILISCGDEEHTGNLSVNITDAPMFSELVKEAGVTITKVEIRKSDNEEGSPYLTIFEGEEKVNLMELTNGITSQLANLEVPVGTYDLVRIYISEAELVFKDLSSVDLKIPSASSSGLKVFIDPPVEVAGGLTADLLLDFDVSRSFVAKGNDGSQGYKFKPTIKAVNSSTVGRIEGTITDVQENPQASVEVSVYAADTLNTSTFSNDLGQYTVLGLKPGIYELRFNSPQFTETIEVAEVTLANSTRIDVMLEN